MQNVPTPRIALLEPVYREYQSGFFRALQVQHGGDLIIYAGRDDPRSVACNRWMYHGLEAELTDYRGYVFRLFLVHLSHRSGGGVKLFALAHNFTASSTA